jgi:hypothetical protein
LCCDDLPQSYCNFSRELAALTFIDNHDQKTQTNFQLKLYFHVGEIRSTLASFSDGLAARWGEGCLDRARGQAQTRIPRAQPVGLDGPGGLAAFVVMFFRG